VYGNFFLGGNGLRLFSHDHRIYSNYFEDCRPAINIGNGGATIPPGPLTSHERPERVHIVHNTLVNNRSNVQMTRRRRGLGANDLVFANNIIVGGDEAAVIDGPLESPTWEGNIVWQNDDGAGDLPAGGYTEVDPKLANDDDRPWRLQASSPAASASAGDYSYVTTDIEGQPRAGSLDIGAEQRSADPVSNHVLTPKEVGPAAPEQERPWIVAPPANVEWIPNRKSSRAS
jgi:poly(beta-D-mannuronate) lyase